MGSLNARNLSSLSDSVPLCRQFWKAGDYDDGRALRPPTQNGQNRLRVHPKFLHSNATSHKWAFGAIAELLDNAVDEVQNGATFVVVDAIRNPRNGDHALLVQDDGRGLDPYGMRCALSFGFSEKQSNVSIGQYGNGLKTSTMRLGADAIIFSRSMNRGTLTQSVGLLSYTFLREIASDDIVVPMVDYKFHAKTNDFVGIFNDNQRRFSANLSAILKWSPFATEVELLKQFDGIGYHGTKIIIFNLWFNDDGCMELDFASDAEDIMVSGALKARKNYKHLRNKLSQNHIANRYRYSLRVYSSILYMHLPVNFKIVLRGKAVEPHHITTDLRFIECIKYRPQDTGGDEVITHIGFLEGAPNLDVHGFNVYHRNRLILPFWSVLNSGNMRGRGVAGVLEANFIRPTHDKQDFEKSTLFQKLETRLKDMTMEYWTCHCDLVGYKDKRAPSIPEQLITNSDGSPQSTVVLAEKTRRENDILVTEKGRSQNDISSGRVSSSAVNTTVIAEKRRRENAIASASTSQKHATVHTVVRHENNHQRQHEDSGGQTGDEDSVLIMQQNRKLRENCLELENTEKQLLLKAERLRKELEEYENIHRNLMIELQSTEDVKVSLTEDVKVRL